MSQLLAGSPFAPAMPSGPLNRALSQSALRFRKFAISFLLIFFRTLLTSQNAISRLFSDFHTLAANHPEVGVRSATQHPPLSSRPIAPYPAKCQNFTSWLLRNTRSSWPRAGTQFRPFRCLTGKRTLGTAMPRRRSWSPAGLQSRDRTRKKAWVFRSPSERLARRCSSERPNCRKVRTPHRTGKAGSVRMG